MVGWESIFKVHRTRLLMADRTSNYRFRPVLVPPRQYVWIGARLNDPTTHGPPLLRRSSLCRPSFGTPGLGRLENLVSLLQHGTGRPSAVTLVQEVAKLLPPDRKAAVLAAFTDGPKLAREAFDDLGDVWIVGEILQRLNFLFVPKPK